HTDPVHASPARAILSRGRRILPSSRIHPPCPPPQSSRTVSVPRDISLLLRCGNGALTPKESLHCARRGKPFVPCMKSDSSRPLSAYISKCLSPATHQLRVSFLKPSRGWSAVNLEKLGTLFSCSCRSWSILGPLILFINMCTMYT